MTNEEKRFYIHKKMGVDINKVTKKPNFGRLWMDGNFVIDGEFSKIQVTRKRLIQQGYAKERFTITY